MEFDYGQQPHALLFHFNSIWNMKEFGIRRNVVVKTKEIGATQNNLEDIVDFLSKVLLIPRLPKCTTKSSLYASIKSIAGGPVCWAGGRHAYTIGTSTSTTIGENGVMSWYLLDLTT